MPQITKYCNTYSQTADSNNAKFSNLVTLKGASGYAETSTISKKGGTRPKPSTVTVTNFQFNLPAGAEVTKIKVEYAHRKLATTTDKYPAIPAPTIDLVGASAKAKTGVAPLGVTKTNTISWTGNWTRSTINSSSFGVKIAYKSNTSKDYTGKVRLSLLRITVEYKVPNFALALSVNGDKTVNKEGTVNITLSNLNKTSYSPDVQITLPSQVTYLGSNSNIVRNSNTSLTWKPTVKSNNSNVGVSFKIRFDTATVDSTVSVTVRETYGGKNKTTTFSISPETIYDDETSEETGSTDVYSGTDDDGNLIIEMPSDIVYQTINEPFTFTIHKEDMPYYETTHTWRNRVTYPTGTTITVDPTTTVTASFTTYSSQVGDFVVTDWGDNEEVIFIITFTNLGSNYLRLFYGGTTWGTFTFLVLPEVNGSLSSAILQLTQEELDRLGDGYSYTIQAYAKIINNGTHNPLSYPILHNFRLGAYNEETPSTNPEEHIIQNAQYNTGAINETDTYTNLTTEFIYNSDYPLYIIITGQYLDYYPDEFELKYTQPVIIDTDYYDQKGRVTQNALPYEIHNTILDGETSSLTINTFQESNPIVAYDFDLPDNFSTNDEIAIRGIEFSADLIADDEVIIDATLRLEGGKTGQRSLVLQPLDTMSEVGQITLGGSTDLWGLSAGDMQNLDQAEIELSFNNLFTNENNQVQLQISNITVTAYYLNITQINEIEKCLINDENIAWYGAYLKNLADLHGLKTDTSYITVKGTDTNEPYVQTIQEKEIEIGFGIDADTVKESSELMKSFVRHITNERDKYNKPILNKIEFPDLYPNEHWDFILDGGISHSVSFKEQEGTLKLIIPAGTSYANEDTYANTRGYNNGIANVNPIITAIPLAETVEITETVHKQNWKIQYPFPENSLLEINCNDRTATLKTIEDENNAGTDITAYADYNNDWFLLYLGEFNFESQTSIIRTVQYNERG